MPRKLMLIVMLTLVAAAWSNPTPSFAQDGEKPKKTAEDRKAEREARDKAFADQLANAKVTLTDAIAKAESATGGKAIMAAYKPGKEGLTVHVMILTDAGRKNVRVDAQTGEVAQPGNKPKRDKKADGPKPKKDKKDKKDKKNKDKGGEDEGGMEDGGGEGGDNDWGGGEDEM
jgi:uncharacterized membrane protein YkoI